MLSLLLQKLLLLLSRISLKIQVGLCKNDSINWIYTLWYEIGCPFLLLLFEDHFGRYVQKKKCSERLKSIFQFPLTDQVIPGISQKMGSNRIFRILHFLSTFWAYFMIFQSFTASLTDHFINMPQIFWANNSEEIGIAFKTRNPGYYIGLLPDPSLILRTTLLNFMPLLLFFFWKTFYGWKFSLFPSFVCVLFPFISEVLFLFWR